MKKIIEYLNTNYSTELSSSQRWSGVTRGNAYTFSPDGLCFTDDLGLAKAVNGFTWTDVTADQHEQETFGDIEVAGQAVTGKTFTREELVDKLEMRELDMDAPADKAMRFNSGKPQLSYILDFDVALIGLSHVMEFGAKKYARGNWKNGLDPYEIQDSLMRHLMAINRGEVLDLNEDGETDKNHSGLPHVDHVSFNALALATFGVRSVKN